MMAITLMVPAVHPDDPPSLVTRVIEADTDAIGFAIRRAVHVGEQSGLYSTRSEDEQRKVLVAVSRQVVEKVDADGGTVSVGRADILWKGNLVTAREWVEKQDQAVAT